MGSNLFCFPLVGVACRQCTQRTVPSSREDRSDTNSTDAGSAGSDQEDADWIFVHDASEADGLLAIVHASFQGYRGSRPDGTKQDSPFFAS